ncbi:uncharacterized protein C8R40DRAFT_1266368 [Lentinula edodes]|uniref:uncharacterized protein n=1 Tax=Lentinula edodes TaxID=5353 RepID=UPI001E8D27AB|nr:uncharacterized protein C8R40DRAFT_1266368 [Lentinula edodes]KAH7873441.1 hypothetical protein C8R40DRAFT_1266368 [Lentinula edodes]
MVLQQAQTYVQATLGTKVGGFVFFVPIEIDDESIMAKQLGHFSCEWISLLVSILDFFASAPREFLPELPGGNFFHERAFKAPSNGAKPTEFSDSQADPKTRIHIDRPREPGNTSVSIALLVPSFGNFQTNIKNIAPSDRAMLFATKMANELCVIFRDEQEREQIFCSILSEFLGEDVSKAIRLAIPRPMDGAARLLLKVKLEQIGTSDPCFQVSLYYLENTRRVRQDVVNSNEEAAAWARARLPSILISHPGPNIQILGGVMTDRPQFRVLTPSVPMYYHVSNQDLFLGFARTLTALNVLFVDLGKLYDNPPPLNPFLPV